MMDVNVFRVPMANPSDVSEVKKLIDSGEIDAKDIVAIIAQTEGDGYSRGYASLAFEIMLAEKMGIPREEVSNRVQLLMIGLCLGIMSPHAVVFTRKDVQTKESKEKRLALGIRVTRVLMPEEYGTVSQVMLVRDAVKEAMKEAGIEDYRDVHCVEVKCPGLTVSRLEDALRRGKKMFTTNLAEASARSKGASALGVALAMGEIEESKLNDEVICKDWSLYSNVATTSAGTEQVACRVIVIGNSTKSVSKLMIGHGAMKDQIDVNGLRDSLRNAGLKFDCCPSTDELNRIVAVFINAGADGVRSVRGRRHTMNSDFLWSFAGMQAKAVCNAIVGAFVQDTMILASAGFEHQGPLGANLVAVITRA